MIGDVERIALGLAALALVAGILVAVADTPVYPVALGVEAVALIYVLLNWRGGPGALSDSLIAFLKQPTAAAPTTAPAAPPPPNHPSRTGPQ